MKSPKCLIYSPYFQGLGGGERYMLSAAECFLKNNLQVDIFWEDKEIIDNISKKLELDLKGINVIGQSPKNMSFVKRIRLSRSYQIILWLSNGSLPTLLGSKVIVHFQRPFKDVSGGNILTQIKLGLTSKVICNSKFTKKYIDEEFGLDSMVIYPPVDVDQFKPGNKENIILVVGRFDPLKKQDVLIKTFKQMVDQGLENWKLSLIGGSLEEPKDNDYLKDLIKKSEGYDISFHPNADFSTLKDYYARAKLFWHAAGYGVDVDNEPWFCEHFGITPVEAMAAGCVPLVINKGGLTEIVRRGEGEKWTSLDDLRVKTLNLINDSQVFNQYQQGAIQRSKDFSKQKFCNQLGRIINNSS